jgi:hypothetical protein
VLWEQVRKKMGVKKSLKETLCRRLDFPAVAAVSGARVTVVRDEAKAKSKDDLFFNYQRRIYPIFLKSRKSFQDFNQRIDIDF